MHPVKMYAAAVLAAGLTAPPATAETRTLTIATGNNCLIFTHPSGTGYTHLQFNDSAPTTQTANEQAFNVNGATAAVASFSGFAPDNCGVAETGLAGTVRFYADAFRSQVIVTLIGRTGETISASAVAFPPQFTPGTVPDTIDPDAYTITLNATDGACTAGNDPLTCSSGDVLYLSAPAPPPPTTGACCLNGACIEATQTACSSAGGLYQGDAAPCEEAVCPEPCPVELTGDAPPLVDYLDLLEFLSQWFPASSGAACP